MDDTASRSGIQRLDLDNYHTWAVQVKCWLVTKGLFKHTQQTLEGEAESDAKALAFLGMTLSEQYLPMFSECEKAKEAWDAFANLFKSKSQARRLQLKSELSSLRKASGEPLLKYFARAKHLRAQLLSVGTTLPDDELTLSVLGGLPGEYETLCTVLMASDRIATLDELLPKLMVVENKTSRPASDNKALVAKPGNVSGSRFQGASQGKRGGAKEARKCHYCGKQGISRRTAGSASARSRLTPIPTILEVRGPMLVALAGRRPMWRALLSKLGKAKHGCSTLERLLISL